MPYTMSVTCLTSMQCLLGSQHKVIQKPIGCEGISWYGQGSNGAYARAMT